MKRELPARPNLGQLKTQAKELLQFYQANNSAARKRMQENVPDLKTRKKVGLSLAQLVLAREYGFSSWAKLKDHIEKSLIEKEDPIELVKRAFHDNDAGLVRKILARHPRLKAAINEPVGPFDSPAITLVRTREMLDVLLEAGADINGRSRWWAGGFGLLDNAKPDLAQYAIQRGATVTVHAAARLGMLDKLRELITATPDLVNARGGDGQTPLHFANTVPIAEFLVDHGADIDALDVDHVSTPAQYMIADRQEIVRYLIKRGCKTDILMAAALEDLDLARKHLDSNPDCIRMRVTDEYFPMVGNKNGGTIYQWTLGWYVSPHQIAKNFGHPEVLKVLMDRSPADVKLINACWTGDEAAVKSLLSQNSDLVAQLSDSDRRQPAHAARNNDLTALSLMLGAGLPAEARGQHAGTPLHWAAWHGNVPMIKTVLKFNPPLDLLDRDFNAPPIGWACHASEHGWCPDKGNYPGTVEALLKAGAKLPEKISGTDEVKKVLRKYGAKV